MKNLINISFLEHYRKRLIIGVLVLAFSALCIGSVIANMNHRNREDVVPNYGSSGQSVPGREGVDGASSGIDGAGSDGTIHTYDYKLAPEHVGERANISGTVLKVFTTKSGVTFLDYCSSIDNCPFSAVIFASDLPKFGDVQKLARSIEITGVLKSYQGRVEIILSDPTQIK